MFERFKNYKEEKLRKILDKLPTEEIERIRKEVAEALYKKYFDKEEKLLQKISKDKKKLIKHIEMLEPHYPELTDKKGNLIYIEDLKGMNLGELEEVLKRYIKALREDVGVEN